MTPHTIPPKKPSIRRRFEYRAGAIVWFTLIVANWLHSQFIAAPAQWWLDTVVSTAEESVKTYVREVVRFFVRIINGIATGILSIFVDRRLIYRRRGSSNRRSSAWKAFWAYNSRAGTLNAVAEREGFFHISQRKGTSVETTTLSNRKRRLKEEDEIIDSKEGSYAHSNTGDDEHIDQYCASKSPRTSFSYPQYVYKKQESDEIAVRASPSPSLPPLHPAAASKYSDATTLTQPRLFSSFFSHLKKDDDDDDDRRHARRLAPTGVYKMRRSGSDLFNRPAGFGVVDKLQRRGLLSTFVFSLEMTISAVFDAFRSMVSTALFLRSQPPGGYTPAHAIAAAAGGGGGGSPRSPRYKGSIGVGGDSSNNSSSRYMSHHDYPRKDEDLLNAILTNCGSGTDSGYDNTSGGDATSKTTSSVHSTKKSSRQRTHDSTRHHTSYKKEQAPSQDFGTWEDMRVWTASDVILQSGYPLEEHVVTTSDGYILTMQRIPRKGSREVVFFQHGVLDTSLGWVVSGAQGSHAFAAYDRGADVWLGNSRANPPRAHADPTLSGAAYWAYSMNELGMEDIAALIGRIHAVKVAELGKEGLSRGGVMSSSIVGGGGGEEETMSLKEKSSAAMRGDSDVHGASPKKQRHAGMKIHKRSGSDSALAALHLINLTADALAADDERSQLPPNEGQIRAYNMASSSQGTTKSTRGMDGIMQAVFQYGGGREEHHDSDTRINQEPGVHSDSNSSDAVTRRPSFFGKRVGSSLKNMFLSGRRSQGDDIGNSQGNDIGNAGMTGMQQKGSLTAAQRLMATRGENQLPEGVQQKGSLAAVKRAGDMQIDDAMQQQQPSPFVNQNSAPTEKKEHAAIKDADSMVKSPPSSSSSSAASFLRRTLSSSLSFRVAMMPDRVSIGGMEQEPSADPWGMMMPSPKMRSLGSSSFFSKMSSAASTVMLGGMRSSSRDATTSTLVYGIGSGSGGGGDNNSGGETKEVIAKDRSNEKFVNSFGPSAEHDMISVSGMDGKESSTSISLKLHTANNSINNDSLHGKHTTDPEQKKLDDDKGDHWPIKNELPSSSRLMITARQQIAGNSNHRIRSSVAGDLATLYEPLYRLQAVGHSLGATSLLIYAVMCKILGRPHYLSKMVLLTPAGFHYKYPTFAWPFLYVLPTVMRLLNSWRPDMGAPVYIPSTLLRYITFKLTVDLQQIPALNELTRAAMRLLLNGDASEWDRALQMPHYAVSSMPAMSLHTGSHFIQLMLKRRFQLYDYGSPAENQKHYGMDCPLDVADHYVLLRGLPIDLVAGRSDGLIAREDVATHYDEMKSAGLQVSYKELNGGHLDMTFAGKDEVLHYVMTRLGLHGGVRRE